MALRHPKIGAVLDLRGTTDGQDGPHVFTGLLGGAEVWENVETGRQLRLTVTDRGRLSGEF